MAASRDYYADLQLPPSADIQEIKKQFRKLALKYHPDRNPGREVEVNSQFQIIQSAHEVLSDPQQKAKYDASMRGGRVPGGSGVKGNPWQNAAHNFPPPPRRTSTRNPPSGAQRWQSRFSSGVPPTAKQQTASDSEAKKTAARAFESMRKPQPQAGSRNSHYDARPPPPPPPPPPMPPRTEAGKNRADAAFGSRKTGFHPRSAMPGDEPPVSSRNYYSRPPAESPPPPPHPPRRPVPSSMPDPLTKKRDEDTSRSRFDSRTGSGANHEAVSAASPPKNTEKALDPDTGRSRFQFPVGDDTFERTQPPSQSAKSSLEDINTSFVKDDVPNAWQFNAGSTEGGSQPVSRNSTGRRTKRGTFEGNSTMPSADQHPAHQTDGQSQTEAQHGGFDADGWTDKFNAQTFVPRSQPAGSSSPTRCSRSNSKRVRTKPTAGSAAVVEEYSSEDEWYEWRGRNAQAKPAAADSPLAMDIDSPPSVPTTSLDQAAGVRNIPLEPSRPEWRPGNPEPLVTDDKPERPAKVPLNARNMGSEDSEEFRASFADLRNVAPIGQQRAGLRSLTDLKDELPFESKASDEPPISLPETQPLQLPSVPQAPRPPPAAAMDSLKPDPLVWTKYLAEFQSYLQKWDVFNGQVVDHFTTRKVHVAKTRIAKGYAFLGARGETDILEYISWVRQDNDVRQRWGAACVEHAARLREFMAVREKMKALL
ncbi:hypothetical protein CDD80_5734 [Ophiocordyceps camponoti-rufipedis]|uniref:J domain-containing protein n=1 Tax=Ophiocordyceps camponoti-rufipedis TaxID=2004952 RepID=A0A2C5YSQ8_9HYPO|nr:hypothetical protein CDD80_5734 [Ophiocordyceps camponoti-rufipedis]